MNDSWFEVDADFVNDRDVVCVSSSGRFLGGRSTFKIMAQSRHAERWGPCSVFSAQGIRASSVDEVLDKTTGVDTAFISAFTNDTTIDNERDQSLSKYRNTDRMWRDLNQYKFGLLSVSGFYKEPGYESNEKTFMVLNHNSGFDRETFFNILCGLGEKYKQSSVLLKPSMDFNFRGHQLDGEVGYWYYTNDVVENGLIIAHKGDVKRLGIVSKIGIEEWVALNASGGSFGGSKMLGTHDAFTFSSFSVIQIDFSHLANWPGTSEHRRRYISCWSRYVNRKVRLEKEAEAARIAERKAAWLSNHPEQSGEKRDHTKPKRFGVGLSLPGLMDRGVN
jgi:hypothetical protein